MSDLDLEQRAINTIRGLCMDGPQAANSGHPGTGMALAPLAHVLWTRVMKYDASDPNWADRDRFILSVGHASILLYSMLHLSGTDLTLDDLKQFRQWESRTPGHPEIHHVKGIDVTTGPLGQGFANAVGMAIAERMQRTRFGADLSDHYVYTICGDGDIQEGVSHEAASLAGHLGLNRLIAIYDDNHITIDGPTELSFTDKTADRFRAYGWNVLEIGEVASFQLADDDVGIAVNLRQLAQQFNDGVAQVDRLRPGLAVRQSEPASPEVDIAPLQCLDFAQAAAGEQQQPEGGDGETAFCACALGLLKGRAQALDLFGRQEALSLALGEGLHIVARIGALVPHAPDLR